MILTNIEQLCNYKIISNNSDEFEIQREWTVVNSPNGKSTLEYLKNTSVNTKMLCLNNPYNEGRRAEEVYNICKKMNIVYSERAYAERVRGKSFWAIHIVSVPKHLTTE